jgi:hypothetical protein
MNEITAKVSRQIHWHPSSQMSWRALHLALSGTLGHVGRAPPPRARPRPRSLPLSLSLPLPPRPGPAHPPPHRLPEALPGRAAGGRSPTAGQTGAYEDGRTNARKAAGTHGPGRRSEARPGGPGPRSGEATATRARKGWACPASAGLARLASPGGGAARARRGKMAPGDRAARSECGPGPKPPRPLAVLVSPSPCWGAGPEPSGGGAGGSGGWAGFGEGAGHGVPGAEGVPGLRGLHRVALQARELAAAGLGVVARVAKKRLWVRMEPESGSIGWWDGRSWSWVRPWAVFGTLEVRPWGGGGGLGAKLRLSGREEVIA